MAVSHLGVVGLLADPTIALRWHPGALAQQLPAQQRKQTAAVRFLSCCLAVQNCIAAVRMHRTSLHVRNSKTVTCITRHVMLQQTAGTSRQLDSNKSCVLSDT